MNKFILIALLIVSATAVEVAIEDHVYVLTDDTFDDFIAENENVLVEFYAPWCGHCKKLTPEYSAAGEKLHASGLPIKLAKVDATEQKDCSGKFGIKGFPTLKFIKNSEASDYNGARTSQAIIDFCTKKSGPAVQALADEASVNAFADANNVAVVFFGAADSDAAKAFSQVASSSEDAVFGASSDAAAREAAKASENGAVMFKKFDEKRNDLASFDAASLRTFVETNSVPNVLPFADKAIQKIFHNNNPAILLWIDPSKDGAAEAEAAFTQSALDKKGALLYCSTNADDGSGNFNKLADYVGADISSGIAVMIVHSAADGMLKYKYNEAATTENINAYVDKWVSKELKPFLKSADVPESNDEPVKVIVGTTFDDIVVNNDRDVMVEFYAPWCGHCKQLDPKYTEAAIAMAGNPNIVLAKCDSTANEVPGVNVKGFPTIKVWPGNAKSAPVDYNGARDAEGIVAYMKEHATKAWVETKEHTDDL